ncbi:hypothetical protein DJ564_08785 [Pseudomonas sp. 31-12]|uniref:hypothetical protein n=1 Tax=Pseudomonas sp. 31-12 TaxID=2201356 RepID=UPI000D6D62C1|nr:hypothetical protein [Pseudomonas sp. 31-12]AWM90910.1 hypothetical protein DJ564_08785 [Pseudomonas sp. 31-12]
MNSPMTNAGSTSNGQVRVFPPEPGIGVLAVAPPYPPGYKPQSDGALGVNINMVHGDRDGLLVYILAYLNMAVGDYIRVYIETKNASVAEFSVTDAHFDTEGNAKNIPFNISAKDMEARFPPLQANNLPLWHEVTRVSGNGTEDSPPVELFYKYPPPGEADTDGGKPFNQGLKLPVASQSIIDQTVIDEGMFVTVLAYFNQSIGDLVVLAFGPLLLEITVTALGDIVFELTPQMLASLAPTNSLVVRWEVFDVVENSSRWSDVLILTTKPGTVLLIAPIFKQADPDNVVNHDELAGGAMVIQVTGVFAKDDLIELTLEGLTRGGDTATHTFSETLNAATRSLDFLALNEWVRNLIGGSARASYELTRAGKTRFSKPADVTVSGSSLPFGLPIVDPLVDNTLPVETATATVQVAKYWPLKIGAIVKLNWQITDQDGIKTLFIFQLIVTDPTQPVIFQVPAKYIAPYANTPLTVQCTVTNPGEVEVFSNLLQLMFGEEVIGELLPPFVVPPATHDIDVLDSLDGITVRVEYLSAKTNDKALFIDANPMPDEKPFPVQMINQNKRANLKLSFAYLLAQMGSETILYWQLIRDGKSVGESLPLTLNIRQIVDGDVRLGAPIIDQADSAGVVDINEFEGDGTVSCKTWPFRGGRYLYDMSVFGTGADGSEHVIELVTKGSLTPDEESNGFRRTLPLAQLLLLQDGSSLHVEIKAHFKGKASITIIFPISRKYSIRNKRPVLSENFDHCPTQLIAPGGSIVLDSMTITFPAGNGYLGITPLANVITGPYPQLPDYSYGQVLEMHWQASGTAQHMHIQFNWNYSYVSFQCRFAQFNDLSVYFFDEAGKTLHHMYLANNFNPQLVTYSTPGHNYIRSIEIRTPRMDLIVCDYFKFARA